MHYGEFLIVSIPLMALMLYLLKKLESKVEHVRKAFYILLVLVISWVLSSHELAEETLDSDMYEKIALACIVRNPDVLFSDMSRLLETGYSRCSPTLFKAIRYSAF